MAEEEDAFDNVIVPFMNQFVAGLIEDKTPEEVLEWILDDDEDEDKPEEEGILLVMGAIINYTYARRIGEWAKMPQFLKIKPNKFMPVLADCYLSVKSELEAVDLTLFWLQGQEDRDAFVGEAFSKLRPAYLSPAAKAVIIERAQTLRFSEDSVAKMKLFLAMPFLNRCHNPDHSHLPRCGPVQGGEEMGLPLSRPKVEAKEPEKEADEPKKNEKAAKGQKKQEAADVPAEVPAEAP